MMFMKSAHLRSLLSIAFTLACAGALSCGLQEHPQGPGAGGGIDPGPDPGPIDPVTPPPNVTGPAPAPAPPSMPNPANPDPGPVPPPSTQPPPVNPAPAGPGVTINGTFVPRDKAIVVLHWGHSNMYGQARTPSDLRSFFYDTQPGLWTYRGTNRFSAAREKTAPSPGGENNDRAGPGMALLRTLATAAPAGGGYHFISIGRGVGSATTEEYLKGSLYYSTFMNLALQLKGKVTFAGMFVMMGITDRHMPMAQQGGFADRMSRIVADVRADLGEPNLPVLHTDYEVTSTGDLSVTSAFGRRIRPLMLSLPERVANLAIVPCDEIPLEDDHHFTMAGHKIWAERGVELMRTRGWLPWAASPTP
jgi:Carbohydrate esterase, sialic acid-specific acetylesterase